jgi:hypothetical protein
MLKGNNTFIFFLYCNQGFAFNCLDFYSSEGKFLFTTFEFGGSFRMSLEGDCHQVEVTPNLELLITFGISWRECVMSFIHNFTTSLHLNWRWTKIPWKSSLLIRYEKVASLEWGWSLTINLPSAVQSIFNSNYLLLFLFILIIVIALSALLALEMTI